jgi:hypothetical protein
MRDFDLDLIDEDPLYAPAGPRTLCHVIGCHIIGATSWDATS